MEIYSTYPTSNDPFEAFELHKKVLCN